MFPLLVYQQEKNTNLTIFLEGIKFSPLHLGLSVVRAESRGCLTLNSWETAFIIYLFIFTVFIVMLITIEQFFIHQSEETEFFAFVFEVVLGFAWVFVRMVLGLQT